MVILLRLSESWRNSEIIAEMHLAALKNAGLRLAREVHETQVSV